MSLELLNRIRSAETFHELETREELEQLWIT
jgi:hypothetical protein